MAHPKQHKTMWTLYHINTTNVLRFHTEEGAETAAFFASAPVKLIAPVHAR